jgi:hypothetical protein
MFHPIAVSDQSILFSSLQLHISIHGAGETGRTIAMRGVIALCDSRDRLLEKVAEKRERLAMLKTQYEREKRELQELKKWANFAQSNVREVIDALGEVAPEGSD